MLCGDLGGLNGNSCGVLNFNASSGGDGKGKKLSSHLFILAQIINPLLKLIYYLNKYKNVNIYSDNAGNHLFNQDVQMVVVELEDQEVKEEIHMVMVWVDIDMVMVMVVMVYMAMV